MISIIISHKYILDAYMKKAPTAWNMFVKKIYKEGKAKDSSYAFKQALVDASKRKAEMGSSISASKTNKKAVKVRKTAKRMISRKRAIHPSMAGGSSKRRRC
jgi:hypothetical protein